ncbi:unnamed protein product [Gongylonema pulchrum]|uniref:ABC transporter ATP-binding protein n=1 Tax=Gongylonema pulchrum TaxID=637853 RepID=A0A183EVV4_9BILA|nr:unnamed protein product [Gongylonema pulchrum]
MSTEQLEASEIVPVQGHPVQIIEGLEKGFQLNEKALEDVLLNPQVADKKVDFFSSFHLSPNF